MRYEEEVVDKLLDSIRAMGDRYDRRGEFDTGRWVMDGLLGKLQKYRADTGLVELMINEAFKLAADVVGDVTDPLLRRQRPSPDYRRAIRALDEMVELLLELGIIERTTLARLESVIRPYGRGMAQPSVPFMAVWESRAISLLSDPDIHVSAFTLSGLLRSPLFGNLRMSCEYYGAWIFAAEAFSVRRWGSKFQHHVLEDIQSLLLRPRVLGEELTERYRGYCEQTFGNRRSDSPAMAIAAAG